MPRNPEMSKVQRELVQTEIETMRRKRTTPGLYTGGGGGNSLQGISKICSISVVWETLLSIEFLCPYFDLGPALMKLLMTLAVLRRFNMLIIIDIDDILIIGSTRQKVESTRDTLIYLLQHLVFLLNLKKSVL